MTIKNNIALAGALLALGAGVHARAYAEQAAASAPLPAGIGTRRRA